MLSAVAVSIKQHVNRAEAAAAVISVYRNSTDVHSGTVCFGSSHSPPCSHSVVDWILVEFAQIYLIWMEIALMLL